MLAIRLPHNIEERLATLAEQTGRTKTFYAKQAILKYLEDMEDQYIALQRLETPSSTITLDELEKETWLGSLNSMTEPKRNLKSSTNMLNAQSFATCTNE